MTQLRAISYTRSSLTLYRGWSPPALPRGLECGVHRGPDKFPRRNAIRAVFLHAMAQDQEREHIDPSTGEPELDAHGKPVKRPMKFAMVQDIVMADQLIALHAAGTRATEPKSDADPEPRVRPSEMAGTCRSPSRPAIYALNCREASSSPSNSLSRHREATGGHRRRHTGRRRLARARAP